MGSGTVSEAGGAARRRAAVGRRLRAGARRGASIGELILWAIVAGFVVASAIGGYNAVTSLIARNDATEGLTTLRANIEKIFAGQSTYANLTAGLLDARGAIPDDWREEESVAANTSCTGQTNTSAAKKCARIRHPFDGRVTVAPDGGRFWIGFQNLDDEDCAALLDVYVGRTRARSGLAAAHVGAAAVSGGKPTSPNINVPYDVNSVGSSCDNGDDSNFAYFQFG